MATSTVQLTAELPACCALLWPWHRVAVGGGTLSRSTGTRSFTAPSGVHLLHTVALVSLGHTRAASGHHYRVMVVWCGTTSAHQQAQPLPHHHRLLQANQGGGGQQAFSCASCQTGPQLGSTQRADRSEQRLPCTQQPQARPTARHMGSQGVREGGAHGCQESQSGGPSLLQSILTAPIHLPMELPPPKPPSTQAMAPQWKGHSQSWVATARPLLAQNKGVTSTRGSPAPAIAASQEPC